VVLASLPAAVWFAFAMLAVAMLALWAPRFVRARTSASWWIAPFAMSLAVAVAAGVVDTRGLLALVALIAACRVGEHASDGALRGFALAVVLAVSAGLLAHAAPGFANPIVLDGIRLSADSQPYTKYLNFDKGVLGLLLLGLHAPSRTRRVAPAGSGAATWWAFAIVAAMVMGLTLATGYARWDPKLPPWWPLWLGSMVFLTALPEEALFRHVVQGGLHGWLGDTSRMRVTATLSSGAIFGLAHAAGGWTYVGLSTVAGIGYALVYARTGSILAAVAAHTGLNLLHFVLFSYPAIDPVLRR
jgi:uncharacterized protein